MTISLAMIIRNSENVLEKCLSSCHDIFDEIVIVDTGSTDRTKEIAHQYTTKVYDFEWCSDFAKARNFSFSLCSSEFVMWLDDDDTLLEKDKDKIKALDFADREIILCKYIYSKDEFGVAECILERERIIKRSLNLQWQKKIHEYLPLRVGNRDLKQFRTDIEIQHNKQHSSSERNLEILEEIIKIDKEPRNFYYFGKELVDYFDVNENQNQRETRYKKAIGVLLNFVRLNSWWEDVFAAYMLIAKCYLNLKDEDKFFSNMFKSIKIEPARAEPYYELACFYMNKNDWRKAIHWFEECLNVKRNKELLSSYLPQYYTWKPALNLVICYNNIGDVQKAYEYNELFLKFRPSDKRGHNNRAILSNSPLRRQFKDGQDKKLNLGCGNKRISGYVNVDVIQNENVDEVFDMKEIPYKDNSIAAISSEHSLEHLSFEDAEKALREFFRVLKPGGELLLYIPDLELCCQKYLQADNSRSVNYMPEKNWYAACIYGIQKDANGSVAEYQYHLSGYSKTEIKNLLESIGFIIDFCENY